jgi:sugar lactone lactonase YvrE
MKAMVLTLLLALMAAPAQAACPCTTIFAGDPQPFIAEGIARDSSGQFYVAGVAARRIVTVDGGLVRNFAQLPGNYSPLGIALMKDTLWVTAATVPQGAGHDGPSALLALDLRGLVKAVYPVPDDGRHVPNDLTFGPDGAVYASDALEGSLYYLAPGTHALTRLGRRALLKSPQGMKVSADGKSLLVADYSLGLVKVDLASGEFRKIPAPPGADARGIDGLARLSDGSFIASQNGLRDPRILRLKFSPDWSKLLSLDVVAVDDPIVADPSLVTADKSGAYLIGVSQWASFAQDRQAPVKPLQPWRIVRLDIR